MPCCGQQRSRCPRGFPSAVHAAQLRRRHHARLGTPLAVPFSKPPPPVQGRAARAAAPAPPPPRARGRAAYFGAAWALWILDLAGFILLLSGLTAMQSACSDAGANLFLSGGAAGYFAPTECSRFFGYTSAA
jgi:hypothetical protein